jgi:hypothetical protein
MAHVVGERAVVVGVSAPGQTQGGGDGRAWMKILGADGADLL